MDSITQVILGAACGEMVAGKKIGNRAMIWGGIGGTIPDLDVFAAFFMEEIHATAFHRGIMHSFLFAALMPWLLAWGMRYLYGKGIYQSRGFKSVVFTGIMLLYALAATGVNLIPYTLSKAVHWPTVAVTLVLGILLARKLWFDYCKATLQTVDLEYKTWVSLFFWSIFTHPILDCFTTWGTQIWQPFADTRVAWNSVAVVDPLGSVPFAIGMVIAAYCVPGSKKRRNWALAGLIWFIAFIALGVALKLRTETVLKNTLAAKNIHWNRYYTGPTIFQNIVWNGLAEGDTAFYFGIYGFNDHEARFQPIITLPKNHDLLREVAPDDYNLKFIKWFSKGYYNVVERPDGKLQINDLRFGILGDSVRGPQSYVFPFVVDEIKNGTMKMHQSRNIEESKKRMGDLLKRVKGL